MNLENKKQIITLGFAFAVGALAVFLTSQYVQNSIEIQTKQLAQNYEQKSKPLLQEIEGMKQVLRKVGEQQAALAKNQAAAVNRPQQAQQQSVAMDVFSLRTPPGKRAMTVLIDTLAAVGGLISPGDSIDVLAHLNIPENNDPKAKEKQKVITVLFQNIQVLAVGSNFNSLVGAGKYQEQQKSSALNVTLALSPEEAGLITFAQENGTLQFTLRSPAEKESPKNIEIASWDALSKFLSEKQGINLGVSSSRPKINTNIEEVEEKPQTFQGEKIDSTIQIFKSGRETKM